MRFCRVLFFLVCFISYFYGLSLGGEVSLLFPEKGPFAVETAFAQDIKLPAGFFVEMGGVYYRLFGMGFKDNHGVWGMFFGDMIGGLGSLGWQCQLGRWEGVFQVYGGGGWLFNMALKEPVAREYIRVKEKEEPLFVTMDERQRALLGWGISTKMSYQWKRLSVGLLIGWVDFHGGGTLSLTWGELVSGSVEEKKKDFDGFFVLRGIRTGFSFRIFL